MTLGEGSRLITVARIALERLAQEPEPSEMIAYTCVHYPGEEAMLAGNLTVGLHTPSSSDRRGLGPAEP